MSTMESFSAEAATASREEELLLWDWQLITLILAFIACLLFFIVTAIISINYVRQWRKIKKEFDTGEFLSFFVVAVNFLNRIPKYGSQFAKTWDETRYLSSI